MYTARVKLAGEELMFSFGYLTKQTSPDGVVIIQFYGDHPRRVELAKEREIAYIMNDKGDTMAVYKWPERQK